MPGAFAVRSVVALLTAWALVTIVPDFARPFAPFGSIGLTADFAGRIVAVDPHGSAAEAGVKSAGAGGGDRIDFARTPPDTLFALFGGLGGRPFFPPGRRIPLALIGPDGAPRSVTLEVQEREPPHLESVGLFVAEVLALGFIALGAFLAWQFPQRRDVLGFFLYAIWFNPGENYVFYSVLPPAARLPQEVLSAFLQAAGLAGFALFALRFPTDRAEGWRRGVERLLPLLVIALTWLALAGSGAEFGRPNRPLWLLTFAVKAALYPLIVAAFLSKLRRLPPVDRQRLRTVIFGCIPGLLFFLIAESIETTSLWQPVFDRLTWTPPEILLDACYLVNALVPLSIGYAVLRRRVLPIDFIVNRGLTLGVVTVLVAMSLEALVLTTHTFLEENHVLSALLLALVLVVFAPVMEKVKDFVNDGLDRFLFARLYRARRELEARAHELAGATSLAAIEAAIVTEPCRTLELAAGALYSLADEGTYTIAAEHDWPADALRTIEAADPLVRTLLPALRSGPTRAALVDRDDLPRGAARPELAVTLLPNAYIEALVLFSAHADGTALTPDEARVVVRFVRACGAVRAHIAAQDMRRELIRLRHGSAAEPLPAPLNAPLPLTAELAE